MARSTQRNDTEAWWLPGVKQFTLDRDSPDAGSTAAIMLSISSRRTLRPGSQQGEGRAAEGHPGYDERFGRKRSSDGISPEQAVDDAIARIKQILSE
jgi:hypothetical protein